MSGTDLAATGQAVWPALVVGGSFAAAILVGRFGARAREPAADVRAVPHAYPNRDPVSVAVDSLAGRSYSRLLDRAHVQLRRFCLATTGRPLEGVPPRWAVWRRRVPAPVRRAQQFRARWGSLRARAAWRDRWWAPRGDPWRSPAESDARFRTVIAGFLVDLGRASSEAGA